MADVDSDKQVCFIHSLTIIHFMLERELIISAIQRHQIIRVLTFIDGQTTSILIDIVSFLSDNILRIR